MEYMTDHGVLYEISAISLADAHGVAIEVWEMSSKGGLLGEARVERGQVKVFLQERMPVEVYARWTSAVVKAAREFPDGS